MEGIEQISGNAGVEQELQNVLAEVSCGLEPYFYIVNIILFLENPLQQGVETGQVVFDDERNLFTI